MALRWSALAAALLLPGFTAVSLAADESKLEVGDKAPEFEAKDADGNAWKSSEHVGKKILVVYFYPADFTGGCTKQACGFRDDMEKLEEAGVEVVGISGDTPETHKLFQEAHDLNFTLLSDPEGEIAKQFGVPVSKGGSVKVEVDGQPHELTRGATIKRWTFIIDPEGKVAHKTEVKNAAEDSKAVLEAVEELKKES